MEKSYEPSNIASLAFQVRILATAYEVSMNSISKSCKCCGGRHCVAGLPKGESKLHKWSAYRGEIRSYVSTQGKRQGKTPSLGQVCAKT